MSVTREVILKTAKLCRINIEQERIPTYINEISKILAIADTLGEVDTTGVEPLVSVNDFAIDPQPDIVTEGNNLDNILSNAPKKKLGYFVVPKVIE